jgi:NAD(P)H-flavin reductase/hemoglobin-like flavoprotein
MQYLFACLFAASPQLRPLYPLAMTHTRVRVYEMLARLIANLEDAPTTERVLEQLARDHRKFGVREKHLEPFFAAVVQTAEYGSARNWTPEKDAAWRSVTGYFARVMAAAARRDEGREPAWWTGEIVQHDLRAETIAVLSIRPDSPLTYIPGQYISVQVPRWPRIWRTYSIANAPRGNGLLDIHVRAVPGGLVSTALVAHCGTGDIITLGAARGEMRVNPDPDRNLVCVAGGTGLAPVKAITEAVVGASGQGRRREVTVYIGVRRSHDLYDMRDLEALRLAYPSLTLIPVVERELDYPGRVGRLPEVVAVHPSFRDCDVYVAGPAGLVAATAAALSGRVPADRLHHDSIDALRRAMRPSAAHHLS